nr:uncharacterized protein LOC109742265 [Aegilops tauschii subsp. strangulata]
MRTQEGLTGTDLLAAFIMRRVLPLQGRSCLIGEMVGLQDPKCMGSTRLSAEQVARGVNDISKANLGEDWRFGKATYSQSNPAPQVSIWSSHFAAAHLLVRPDATRGVLLNAIRHPYARAPLQVEPVAPEEPAAHGGEEVAKSDAGTGVARWRWAGEAAMRAEPSPRMGRRRAARMGKTASRPQALKRMVDPAGARRPAKRKRGGGHGRPTPVPVLAGSPIALARAAAEAATAEGAAFRRSRSDLADQAEEEGRADSDLGLDPNDAEALAWRDRNRAEAELEAPSVRAWTDAAEAWARPGTEPVWREMPEGTVVAATVFEPSSVREHDRGGRAEVVIPDRGVMEVEDDSPPRADVVERAGSDGGGGGVALEETLRAAVSEAPPTQEEAALDAVSRRLRGPSERLEAFAKAKVERTRDLERAVLHLDAFRVAAYNRLLGKHRELVERLAAKEEELRVAAAEVLSWRTRLLRAGQHYDRLIAVTGRLGVKAAQARAEAAAARRSLDEANRLHEQLAGHKSHLEAEVDLLKAEATKVAEAQQALVTTTEGAREDEARRREAAEKAAEEKDAELKAALAKAAYLEKALEERDRAIQRERRGAFPEMQRLAEEAVRY